MEHRKIDLALIEQNNGQIKGLPSNPRKWNNKEVTVLKKSIEDLPELLEARGCIVYPFGDKYVVLGGNMRIEACRRLQMKEVPCIVLDENTPVDKLKEIVVKDNGNFGDWDWDALANEWDGDLLREAQVIPWDDDDAREMTSVGEVDMGNLDDSMALKFKYREGEKMVVESALDAIDTDHAKALKKLLKIDGVE